MANSSPTGPIGYREEGVDIASKYIGNDDAGLITAYISNNSNLGILLGFGYNSDYQLGDSSAVHRSAPVQIGSIYSLSKIAAAEIHSLAVKTNGTLWVWGWNLYGQLGINSSNTDLYLSSPVQIGTLTNWSQISTRYRYSLAIKTNGTLWSWGLNNAGQLGDGTITHRSSPVQIGSLTDWSQISAGADHALAIKTDGTLWAWGSNGSSGSGQLGDGTIDHRSSPVQIGSLTNWSRISGGSLHSLAVKTDGTLWAWGGNQFGAIGDGTVVTKSSPVQIGALTNWSQVSAGSTHSAAVKTDGTLWAWGNNANGQLGDGSRTHRSSPVQIGSLTTWSQVAAGHSHSLAIKTDGTLWSWGNNGTGQLGDGTTTHRSSPVQVGSLTGWSDISGGWFISGSSAQSYSLGIVFL